MSAAFNLQFNFPAIANQKDQRDSNEIVVHQMNTAHCLRFTVSSVQAYTQMIIKIHYHCIWILICSFVSCIVWTWKMFKSRKNDYLVHPLGWNSNDISLLLLSLLHRVAENFSFIRYLSDMNQWIHNSHTLR